MSKCKKSIKSNKSNKEHKKVEMLNNLSEDQQDVYTLNNNKITKSLKDKSKVISVDVSKKALDKIKEVITTESADLLYLKKIKKNAKSLKEMIKIEKLNIKSTEKTDMLKGKNKILDKADNENEKNVRIISSKNKENEFPNNKSTVLSVSNTHNKRYPSRCKINHEIKSNIYNPVLTNEIKENKEEIKESSVKTRKRLANLANGNQVQSNSCVEEKKAKIFVNEDGKKSKPTKIEKKIKNENKITNKIIKNRNKKSREIEKIDIPIDKECKELLNQVKIYVENNEVFDVMLNQTNLQFNNNKFYLIQLLKDHNKPLYYVWMRWARVGKIGQMKLTSFNDNLASAKECFMKKFFDKTKNDWQDRQKFVKISGKYDLVQIDYSKKEIPETVKIENQVKLEPIESKLEEKLQDLMRIVFDLKEMNDVVTEMKYDYNKVPLGRLTENQIKAGYLALRQIEGLLSEGHSSNNSLVQACNTYYTRIPHDFGMRVPTLIRSIPDIKRELELLETLSDIKIALKLINESSDMQVHPLDRHYHNLHCDIKLVASDDPVYQLINDYLLLTHGSTHTLYNLEMLDLFEVRKEHEWKNFDDKGNRMLLWHGSRTTNYGGIISQGLRIAPAEAPVTGHMFGKGIYFADMSTKSANYVYPTRSKNTGFLLLCEVSLGTSNELVKENYRASKLPPNCHSVKGLGIIAPDQSTWKDLEDGTVVPVGIPINTGLADKRKGYVLNYNEYIVYKQNQVKMRYLVKVRFNFK